MKIIMILSESLREVKGLFIEDLSLTLGFLICLAIFAGIHVTFALNPVVKAVLLFLGLGLLLLENVRRSSLK